MAIHSHQDMHSPGIFQETGNKNSSENSEYLHHSRAREVTNTLQCVNTLKLQCYIENYGYGF